MLHVRTRRRLAAAAVLATLAAGAAALLVVRHAYTPTAVERASREALSGITGMEARLAGGRLVGVGHADFSECAFFKDGREVASVAPLAVHGFLMPSGKWALKALSPGTWRLELDLDDPSAALDAAEAFLRLFESLRPYVIPVSFPQADVFQGRERIEVALRYGPGAPLKYIGNTVAAAHAGKLKLAAPCYPLDEHGLVWPVSTGPDCIMLKTALPASREPLAQSVLAANAPGLDDILAEAPSGEIEVRWTREGEEVELGAESMWPVGEAAVAAHGIQPPEGHLDVALRRLRFVDGAMREASGGIRFRTARIPGAVLLDWLEAAGMAPPGADDAPDYFESVTLSADFEVRDGLLRVRPLPDAPGVVWANVNGEEIVIFAGAGEVPLEEFLENAAKIEPRAVESDAPETPRRGPSDASNAAEESRENEAPPAAPSDTHEDKGAHNGDDPDDAASPHPVEEEEVAEGGDE